MAATSPLVYSYPFRPKLDGTSDLICLQCLTTVRAGQDQASDGEDVSNHHCTSGNQNYRTNRQHNPSFD